MKYISLIFFFVLIFLGTWQVYRWEYKKEVVLKLQNSNTFLSSNIGKESEYSKIHLECKMSDENIIYVYAGAKGYCVLVLGEMEDKKFILINIGTVLRKGELKIKGIKNIEGILLFGVKKPLMVKIYDEKSDIWFGIDVKAISEQLGVKLEPYIIWTEKTDIAEAADNGTFTVYNHHLGYIATWYGLALILACYMIYQRIYRS